MSYAPTKESHKLDVAAFRTFLFQGKALFTMQNVDTGNYITFNVKSPKKKRDAPEDFRFFDVYVKALGDRYSGSRYIGRIDRKLKSLKPYGFLENDHPGVNTTNWLIKNWSNLEKYEQADKLHIFHLGQCCKCGLPLTVPESIKNGIGPKCKEYREGNSIKILKELNLWYPGAKYEDVVPKAIEEHPMLIEKIFIPDSVRRSDLWVGQMSDLSEMGLF